MATMAEECFFHSGSFMRPCLLGWPASTALTMQIQPHLPMVHNCQHLTTPVLGYLVYFYMLAEGQFYMLQ